MTATMPGVDEQRGTGPDDLFTHKDVEARDHGRVRPPDDGLLASSSSVSAPVRVTYGVVCEIASGFVNFILVVPI